MTIDAELSRAVTVYVTTHPHGFPHRDAAALAAEFGVEPAAAVQARVDALIGGLFELSFAAMAAEGPFGELADVYRTASKVLARSHPELSPEALAAIASYYTYCVK